MDRPSQGEIWIGETNLSQMDDADLTRVRRERIGFIFQFFNLLSTLTVFENVALPLQLTRRFSSQEIRSRVLSILKTVDLAGRMDFYPARLSGGEMQRTAIARALVHQPDIILADEPTGNLDSENGQIVLEMLRRIAQENEKTILMATHSEEAAHYAGRTIRMRDGRILEPVMR
jgi:putative ABC transport system ATP-binding protein